MDSGQRVRHCPDNQRIAINTGIDQGGSVLLETRRPAEMGWLCLRRQS